MELFLIRHAIAEERRGRMKDAARRLTPVGQQRFAAEVKGMRRLGLEFDRVVHSPWTRAVETAELLRPVLTGESAVHAGLAAPPTEALLAGLQGARVAVVGHEPWLTELLALLVLGRADLADAFVLKKGGLAWLEGTCRPGGMHVLAFVPPRLFRL